MKTKEAKQKINWGYVPAGPIRMVTYDLSELKLWKVFKNRPKTMNKDEQRLWNILYED